MPPVETKAEAIDAAEGRAAFSLDGARIWGAGAEVEVMEEVTAEEDNIVELPHSADDEVQPQRVRVARRHDNEWVFWEEDYSGVGLYKLRRICRELEEQVMVNTENPIDFNTIGGPRSWS